MGEPTRLLPPLIPMPDGGWWECAAGGGVRGRGGERRYFHPGQPMPQALLLPPQTWWEKLRGLQPSYEAGVRTVWALAKRANEDGK